jgi:hypothetical protein
MGYFAHFDAPQPELAPDTVTPALKGPLAGAIPVTMYDDSTVETVQGALSHTRSYLVRR